MAPKPDFTGLKRHCNICSRDINIGTGGDKNFAIHESSNEHRAKELALAAQKKPSRIASFFKSKPKVVTPSSTALPSSMSSALPLLPSSGSSTAVPSSLSSASLLAFPSSTSLPSLPVLPSAGAGASQSAVQVIDVDMLMLPDLSPSDHQVPLPRILQRLESAIASLPDSIPVGNTTDAFSAFAIDPCLCLEPGQDPWEDFVHEMFDSLLWQLTTVDLSHLVRRGPNGMDGFYHFVHTCIFFLRVDLALMESRVERVVQAMLLLGASDEKVDESVHAANVDTPTSSPSKTPTVRRRSGCPGQLLDLGPSPAGKYPFGIHVDRELPWGVEIMGEILALRSVDCSRRISKEETCCSKCSILLRHPVIKGIVERNETGIRRNTNWKYLPVNDLHDVLDEKNSIINELKLAKLNSARTLLVRARNLEAHKRFTMAVSQGNIPRLHSLVSTALKNGESIYSILDKIDLAICGVYSPKSYAEIDFQRLYLFQKLGGRAVAEIAHRTLGLPSMDVTHDKIGAKHLLASAKMPTLPELLQNLDTVFPEALAPQKHSLVKGPGFQLMADEIKIQGRMRWDPERNLIIGICREHGKSYSMDFVSPAQADILQVGIHNKTVHLASEATVFAVSSFSSEPKHSSARAFVVSGTCKHETVPDQRHLLETAVKAVSLRSSNIGGRLYGLSSDGDAKRRKATALITLTREVDQDGPLFAKLGTLLLFDYQCGHAGDISANIDHITPHRWEGEVSVAKVVLMTCWKEGRQVAEKELKKAEWDPPFSEMESGIGYNMFCPFGNNKMVLIDGLGDGERNEDVDEMDATPAQDTALPAAESITDLSLEPDAEDVTGNELAALGGTTKKYEAYLSVDGGTQTQHKSTYLRLASSLFSIAESKDRLKRIRGFARDNESGKGLVANTVDISTSNEPMVLLQDPAALLVRSKGLIWLAIVEIVEITVASVGSVNILTRLLKEPNVRVKVQLMELSPTKLPLDGAYVPENDWEWTEGFVRCFGSSSICEVDGRWLQVLDPEVVPSTRPEKNGRSTYQFKSAELLAIAMSMYSDTRSELARLEDVAFGPTFPYRTSAGKACFLCEDEGVTRKGTYEQCCCTLCPTTPLSVKEPTKVLQHMAIHQLFDSHINRDENPCGLCLSTGLKCAIRLTKGNGRNGATRIDLTKSRCPNLLKIMFASASKFTLKNPCTNVPIQCPLCRNEADAVWKYNLESHITTVHPTANRELHSHLYEISRGERVGLKTLSQIKERSTASKTRRLEEVSISEEHTTQFAFRSITGEETSESEEDEEGPDILPTVLEEVTENLSTVRVAEEDIPAASLGEIDGPADDLPAGRRKHIPKRRPECEYNGDSDHCAESDCEDSRKTEITCTGPACGQKYHLVCVALDAVPEGGWFCDEDCRENAGFRRRGAKKTRKRTRVV